MSFPAGVFYVFAALAVVSALGMVLNLRNTVAGAMCLVVTMISLAGIYVVLEAHFVAVLQIMVYAGAILVLFLFVVMLLNLRSDAFSPPRSRIAKLAGVALGVWALVGFLGLLPGALPPIAQISPTFGSYRDVGLSLYRTYVVAFEVTSFLLLAAIVGAVVLAKRRLS
ncbi:MAG: NADH-quinone oxidoreductase subunit J [Deltaproteobacteria bacterium]|nr:NADH-quinone oxidoreductase subunit J [Deltaproteobacteria bacterium]